MLFCDLENILIKKLVLLKGLGLGHILCIARMHNDIRYSEVSGGCNALLCETNELLMLIIENKRSAERRMRLNEFKSAFVRQSKQPFGAALPLVSEQPGLAVKIIAEAVIYVFKARVRNGAYALLPI